MKVTIEISDEDLLHLKLWWTHDNEESYEEVHSWFCHNVAPVVVEAAKGAPDGS
jgi:hypothetical protein